MQFTHSKINLIYTMSIRKNRACDSLDPAFTGWGTCPTSLDIAEKGNSTQHPVFRGLGRPEVYSSDVVQVCSDRLLVDGTRVQPRTSHSYDKNHQKSRWISHSCSPRTECRAKCVHLEGHNGLGRMREIPPEVRQSLDAKQMPSSIPRCGVTSYPDGLTFTPPTSCPTSLTLTPVPATWPPATSSPSFPPVNSTLHLPPAPVPPLQNLVPSHLLCFSHMVCLWQKAPVPSSHIPSTNVHWHFTIIIAKSFFNPFCHSPNHIGLPW